MTPSPQHTPSRKRRWWLRGLVVLLVVAVITGAISFLFRAHVLDEWRLWQFRRAAAAGAPDLPQEQERLLGRLLADEVKLDLADRLAHDTDPRVRAAAVDVLLANQPRAKKQDARQGLFAIGKTGSWRIRVEEAVRHLLEDDDDAVRTRALQAVCELEWAAVFQSLLEKALKTGSKEDRILVAESLAHWNGCLLPQIIADANQPDEVRLAAMRSPDLYGDKEIAPWRNELQDALQIALPVQNNNLRRTALVTLRHAARPAFVWLDILCDERQKEDHALVLRTWIDVLGSETVRGRHWWETHNAWFRAHQAPRRCAIASYVMCEAAKIQMQHLDKTAPIAEPAALQDRQGLTGQAFDKQLVQLENILSVVSAVHWYCVNVDKDIDFTIWLPHETPQGAPPQRKLKAFQFQQAKPIWEWCLDKKAAYPTRFLTANNIKNYGQIESPRPVGVRPLGTVMEELLIGQTEYQLLRNRYGKE
jgi:hypothetical protein